MKETIWNLQQEEKRLQDEIDTLGQDRDKLQDETREVRSKRINEEANLVRLKGQQKVIEEKRMDEEKKSLNCRMVTPLKLWMLVSRNRSQS